MWMERRIARRCRSIANSRELAQLARRGRAEPQEFEIGRYLFKQHIDADLNLAALRPRRRQKRRDLVLEDDFTYKGRWINSVYLHWKRIVLLHAKRRRVDDDAVAGRIGGASDHFQVRIVGLEALRQLSHRVRRDVIEPQPRNTRLGHGSRDRAAYPAAA